MAKIKKYGMEFPEQWNPLDIELYCFRTKRTVDQGGLGQPEHFWRVVEFLWGKKNLVRNTTKLFLRNPWSEEMIEELSSYRYVGIGGAGGTTKSTTTGLWILVNYLANSRKVLGLYLSTSLKEARRRGWGELVDFVRAVPSLPLKVVDSVGVIRYQSPTFVASDRASISLIAAERKQEREAVGKLIGQHNDLVILFADELTELAPAVLEYALPGGNLTSNPEYQFIGAFNPAGYYDPAAEIWKPEDGWTSISVESHRWKTRYGIALHFDALKSPNVEAGKVLYPFLPTSEKIEEARRAEGGENSLRFWRMIRGFMCPMGQEDLIYPEIDIVKYKGEEPPIWADTPLIKMAALDPGFTNGGDRSKLKFAALGRTVNGIWCLGYYKTVILTEDVTNKTEERSYQIARQFRDACIAENVLPRNAGVDATGAGNPFCDIVATIWSPEIYRCSFGGKASELSVSLTNPKKGYEQYYNRVSEIWFTGKELLRQGQIKGISPEMAREMSVRKYGTTGVEKRIYVESKEDMKVRTGGVSPDDADAGFILIDLARARHGFGAKFTPGQQSVNPTAGWRNMVNRLGRPRRNW